MRLRRLNAADVCSIVQFSINGAHDAQVLHHTIATLFIKITLDVDALYRRQKGKHNLLILLDANYTLHPGAWPHS